MRVRVRLRREGGAYRQPRDRSSTATGQLSLSYREAQERRVPVLALLGTKADWPRLFEPRLTAWAGSEFKFLGLEREDRAWVLQEWACELLV
jgi:hypothetical protein